MFTPMRRARFVLVLILLLGAGCSSGGNGKPVYSVQGQAFKGTQPMAGAVVAFHSLSAEDKTNIVRPNGTVAEDGSFKLTTYKPNDGAPKGEYAVTILWMDKAAGSEFVGGGESRVAAPDRLKNAYSNPATTKLRAKVTNSSSNPVRLEVP
jgi:hypothetical protein